ncbi:unnamed protein product [Durusdinium trenchii]|uniref:UBA domain-containing protein n=1 Tax=Durusdinium trenchii TaxID=1381693 RepID=A0ABP0LHV1_9DINO
MLESAKFHLEGTLGRHETWVTSLATTPDAPDIMLSSSRDGTLRQWHLPDFHGQEIQPKAVLKGHTDTVSDCKLSKDGQFAVSCGWDRAMRVWYLVEGEEVHDGKTRKQCNSVAFSADNRQIITVGGNRIDLWNTLAEIKYSHEQRGYTFESELHTDWISQTAMVPVAISTSKDESSDSKESKESPLQFVTVSWDHQVKLWDLKTMKLVRDYLGHEGVLLAVTVSPDASLIATGGKEAQVRLWDRLEGTCLYTLDVEGTPSKTLEPRGEAHCWHSTGRWRLSLWTTGQPAGTVNALDFSPAHYHLAVATDVSFEVYDLELKKQIFVDRPHEPFPEAIPWATCLKYREDANRIFVGHADGIISTQPHADRTRWSEKTGCVRDGAITIGGDRQLGVGDTPQRRNAGMAVKALIFQGNALKRIQLETELDQTRNNLAKAHAGLEVSRRQLMETEVKRKETTKRLESSLSSARSEPGTRGQQSPSAKDARLMQPPDADLWPHVPGYESDENDHEDAETKVASRAKESLKEVVKRLGDDWEELSVLHFRAPVSKPKREKEKDKEPNYDAAMEQQLGRMLGMGFPFEEAKASLEAHGWDVQRASMAMIERQQSQRSLRSVMMDIQEGAEAFRAFIQNIMSENARLWTEREAWSHGQFGNGWGGPHQPPMYGQPPPWWWSEASGLALVISTVAGDQESTGQISFRDAVYPVRLRNEDTMLHMWRDATHARRALQETVWVERRQEPWHDMAWAAHGQILGRRVGKVVDIMEVLIKEAVKVGVANNERVVREVARRVIVAMDMDLGLWVLLEVDRVVDSLEAFPAVAVDLEVESATETEAPDKDAVLFRPHSPGRWQLLAAGLAPCQAVPALMPSWSAEAWRCLLLAGWDGEMLPLAALPGESECSASQLLRGAREVKPMMAAPLPLAESLQGVAALHLSGTRLWAWMNSGTLQVWDLSETRSLGRGFALVAPGAPAQVTQGVGLCVFAPCVGGPEACEHVLWLLGRGTSGPALFQAVVASSLLM